MSILLGMVSLAMICAFVLIFASFSIAEYNKSHTAVKQEKIDEDHFAYLFSVYEQKEGRK